MLQGQQTHFPEGQFVVEYEGKIVGFCATFRINEAVALAPHTWMQITGGGFASRHDAKGDWLYGMEIVVHPDYRGMRIGQRLYMARKRLCTDLKLRGIVFGGRMPGLARAISRYGSAEGYVQAVVDGSRRDATLSFQLRNGFEVIGLLREYVPSDHESLGYAAHLIWRNPQLHDHPDTPRSRKPPPAGFGARRIGAVPAAPDRLVRGVRHPGRVLRRYRRRLRADFVAFPELITLQLLSIENAELSPVDSIRGSRSTRPGQGALPPPRRALQHQYHRRLASHAPAERRHPQRLLCVPA